MVGLSPVFVALGVLQETKVCIIYLKMFKEMFNKVSLKFTFGFLGILVVSMVVLVVTCYVNEGMPEPAPEMNLADKMASN